MSGILIKWGNLETALLTRKTRCEDEGRDEDDASTRQEMPKIARKHPKLDKTRGTDSSRGLRRSLPCRPFVSDIQPPELRDDNGLLFKNPNPPARGALLQQP